MNAELSISVTRGRPVPHKSNCTSNIIGSVHSSHRQWHSISQNKASDEMSNNGGLQLNGEKWQLNYNVTRTKIGRRQTETLSCQKIKRTSAFQRSN